MLTVEEYEDMIELPNGAGPVPKEPAIAVTELTITGSSQQHTFQARTRLVRLATSEPCRIRFGTNPDATGGGRLATDQTEFRGIPAGATVKLARITSS